MLTVAGTACTWLLAKTLAGRLSLGAFGAYLSALQAVAGAFTRLLAGLRSLGESVLYVGDVQAFLATPEEPPAPADAAPFPARATTLDLVRLRFAYPGGPEVLHDIDLTICPQEKLAVVGANEVGKSTLVKVLLGLYRPTEGGIRVDGVDAADFAPESRRAAGTAIFQQYVRYPLTARENVAVGRVERLDDLAAIATAAQWAGAEFLAELPHGWDTVLWKEVEGGVELSGGQWQRVATARALLRTLPASGPPRRPATPDGGAPETPAAWLLVMDEPTAALDPVAEAAVFARFQEIAVGRTAVMVSHRLASARLADRILVLAGGRNCWPAVVSTRACSPCRRNGMRKRPRRGPGETSLCHRSRIACPGSRIPFSEQEASFDPKTLVSSPGLPEETTTPPPRGRRVGRDGWGPSGWGTC